MQNKYFKNMQLQKLNKEKKVVDLTKLIVLIPLTRPQPYYFINFGIKWGFYGKLSLRYIYI